MLRRPAARAAHDEQGQAVAQYVGAILVACSLVLGLVPHAAPAAARLARSYLCAVDSVVSWAAGGPTGLCRAAGGPDGPGSPGSPDGPDGPDGPGDPDDPGDPGDLPTDPPLDPDNPDNPQCQEANPSSGPLNAEEPTLVQVGCRELYVPKGCEEEWAAYQGAAEGKPRQDAAKPLGTCVRDRYESLEPTCITSSTSEIDREEIQILFIKISNTDGLVIEKLGDGRVRAHLLEGAEVGGGVSGELSNISFNFAGVTGYENDTTYEFESMQAAQEWLDWYEQLRMNSELVWAFGSQIHPIPGSSFPNQHAQQEQMKAVQRLQELKKTEPAYHSLAEATTATRKVTIEGGVSFPVSAGGKKGGVGLEVGPTVEGSYTGEVQVEDRRWSDGSQTVGYKSSDAGGFLVGLKMGGKGLGKPGADGKQDPKGGGGAGSFNLGKDWAGTTQTSVTWAPDGQLSKLIITMDDQTMQTLHKAGIDLNVVLPYGFGASVGYSEEKKEGSSNVTEMILDFNQYPELREQLGPTIDEMFPREDDGDLRKGDVEIDFGDEAEQEALRDVVDEKANVRRLDYALTEDSEKFSQGIDLAGIDLFKASFTHIESSKDLNGSSLEVTDVEGQTRTLTPAPKCKDEAFVAPGGYWESGWSDPPTPKPVP